MGKKIALFLLSVLLLATVLVKGYKHDYGGDHGGGSGGEEWEDWGEKRRERIDRFLLRESKDVVRTESGEMRILRGYNRNFGNEKQLHIGFITMEPKSLFIPHYLDFNLILFIRRGEARVGSIYKDGLAEQTLKDGDVYRIEAGSVFYLENVGEGQILQVICSIDSSGSMPWQSIHPFYIGGGKSILSGFDPVTLSTAFNVSTEELRQFMSGQDSGAIVSVSPDSHAPSKWTRFLKLEQNEKQAHMKKIVNSFAPLDEQEKEEEERPSWSFRKLLLSFMGKSDKSRGKARKSDDRRATTKLDSYNLYDRKPDFRNDYGWSLALDESDYSPLARSGVGVYLVNLTAGSMLAPHINPTATEYGIVLGGSGTIQIVYPNGTLATNTEVNEGDVFMIPRYFPFCQIASRNGPFEFFGFSTSSQKNLPQFLVGSNSLLHTLRSAELAASFGLTEEQFDRIIDAQREGVILPTAAAAPPEVEKPEGDKEKIPKLITKFGDEFVGF